MSVSSPALITQVNLRLAPNSDTSSNVVLQKSELLLDFGMPIPLETGCLIYVQLPIEFTRLYQEMSAVQVYGMFGFIKSLPFTVKSNNLVEIRDACTSYTDHSIAAKLRIKSVVNPSSVRQTSPFLIKVHSASNQLLAQTQVGLEKLKIPDSAFAPGTLRAFVLTPSNPTVQESSNVSLTFQTMNSLSANATIVIDFPSSVLLSTVCVGVP